MAVLSGSEYHRSDRGIKALWGVRFLLFAMLTGLSLQAQAPISEYQLKAVYLYNFAQFVEWPTSAFVDKQTPLVIGILGSDPFGAYLDDIVRGEKVNNRQLSVQRYRRVEEIKTCHVLYISRSETDRLDQILVGLKGRSVLTVGDSDGFARRGGMIRFVNEKSKIRLRIGLEAAKSANLTISSKLLRPAQLVEPGKD